MFTVGSSMEKKPRKDYYHLLCNGNWRRIMGRICVCWSNFGCVCDAYMILCLYFFKFYPRSISRRGELFAICFDFFAGAIGCSLLAYILPCLIHLKIKGRAMRLRLIIKDLVIIFLSVIVSILTMVVIIGEIAKGELK